MTRLFDSHPHNQPGRLPEQQQYCLIQSGQATQRAHRAWHAGFMPYLVGCRLGGTLATVGLQGLWFSGGRWVPLLFVEAIG